MTDTESTREKREAVTDDAVVPMRHRLGKLDPSQVAVWRAMTPAQAWTPTGPGVGPKALPVCPGCCADDGEAATRRRNWPGASRGGCRGITGWAGEGNGASKGLRTEGFLHLHDSGAGSLAGRHPPAESNSHCPRRLGRRHHRFSPTISARLRIPEFTT